MIDGHAAAVAAAAFSALACRLLLRPGPAPAVRRLGALRGAAVREGPARTALPGPVLLDLVAAVLRAGAPVTTALRVVADAAADHGDEGAAAQLHRLAEHHDLGLDVGLDAGVDAGLDAGLGAGLDAAAGGTGGGAPAWVVALAEALALAREAGVAVAPLLSAAAEQERRARAAAARVAAARLGVQVVLPTGLCLLPAFVLLAVVPLVLALLGTG